MGKGSKNERHLRDCYEDAGYQVYRPATVRFGENDMWGLFDLACLSPSMQIGPEPLDISEREMHLVQAKTNAARGVTQWFEDAKPFEAVSGVTVRFAVRHDREGWRIAGPTHDGYTWLYDGRDSDACIGDGLTNYLKGE